MIFIRRKVMYDDIRNKLNKATDELIKHFAPYNSEKTNEPSYKVKNADELQKLLTEHGIVGNSDNKAHKISDSMDAVMRNLVNIDVKHALDAGKAGEYILQAIERASRIAVHEMKDGKHNILKGTLYDMLDNTRLARPYIDLNIIEPAYVKAAKATHHLADLLESSIKLLPEIIELEEVVNALSLLKLMSIRIFTKSSEKLREAGTEKAADQIEALAKHLSSQHVTEEAMVIATINDAISIAEKGLRKAYSELKKKQILTEKEAEDFIELTNKRLKQIEKAKGELL